MTSLIIKETAIQSAQGLDQFVTNLLAIGQSGILPDATLRTITRETEVLMSDFMASVIIPLLPIGDREGGLLRNIAQNIDLLSVLAKLPDDFRDEG